MWRAARGTCHSRPQQSPQKRSIFQSLPASDFRCFAGLLRKDSLLRKTAERGGRSQQEAIGLAATVVEAAVSLGKGKTIPRCLPAGSAMQLPCPPRTAESWQLPHTSQQTGPRRRCRAICLQSRSPGAPGRPLSHPRSAIRPRTLFQTIDMELTVSEAGGDGCAPKGTLEVFEGVAWHWDRKLSTKELVIDSGYPEMIQRNNSL